MVDRDAEFAEAVARFLAGLRRSLIERSKPLDPDIQRALAARMDELYEPCHKEPNGSRAARTVRVRRETLQETIDGTDTSANADAQGGY